MNTNINERLLVVTWNARGLNNKYFELKLFLEYYNIDILLVTETKLAPHINFYMPGYKIYRADHPSGNRKGGSAVFVKNVIFHDELLPVIEDELQMSRILITLNNRTYQIGSFYSAPVNKITLAILWNLGHILGTHYLIGGDFNAKHPRWGSNLVNPRGRLLLQAATQLSFDFLYPVEPTYFPDGGQTPDVLDIFICKSISHICSVPSVIPELSSDHYPVMLTINSTAELKTNAMRSLIQWPFDWRLYSSTLEEITEINIPLKSPHDIDKAVSALTRYIHYAAEMAGKNRNPTPRNKYTLSPHIKQLLQEKKKCRRLWEQTRYPPFKASYNRATKNLREAMKEEHSAAIQNNLNHINLSDGSLWKKTKYLTKHIDRIPPLKVGSSWLCSSEEKVNIFSEILENQFNPNPIINPTCEQRVMEDINAPLQLSPLGKLFTPAQVSNIIQRLPRNKAPGSDLIVSPLLKAMPRKTLVLLTQIFNAILRLTYFPTRWKHAIIVMIPKPEKLRNDPSNYRPISLLPLFSKIFERLLLPQLLEATHSMIPATQFGFRPGHSCPQQLHRVVDSILDTYENESVCLGLFIDTTKAFDKVWHEGLLHKIKPVFTDTMYRIILSYLSKRTFSVKYENSQSPPKSINAGVPQGSVIGPFLYLIYVSDFPKSDSVKIAQFADDVAILSTGSCQEAAMKLQTFTKDIDNWCMKWKIIMNPKKSKIVKFTYKRKLCHYSTRRTSSPNRNSKIFRTHLRQQINLETSHK